MDIEEARQGKKGEWASQAIEVKEKPYGTVGNIRDGYGTPISHYECPECHNLDAGFMRLWHDGDKEEEKRYYRSVIKMYQGIRGFNK